MARTKKAPVTATALAEIKLDLSAVPPQVLEAIRRKHWSEADLEAADVSSTPVIIEDALKDFWSRFAAKELGHVKIHLTPDPAIPTITEGAVVAWYGGFSGLKDIYRGPTSPVTGPAREVDIILRDLSNGKRLMTLEGPRISNGRTGWYASQCIEHLFPGKRMLQVCLVGAGAIAEATILSMNNRVADRISRVLIFSLSDSNRRLVEKLSSQVVIKLEATAERGLLAKADFLITATSSHTPVVTVEEIGAHSVVLALGIDELPEAYFDRLIQEKSLILVDDIVAVEQRNVDALALYYSRKGERLTVEGKNDGVMNFANFLQRTDLTAGRKGGGPAHLAPVGLGSMDLAVARAIYLHLIQRLTHKMHPQPLAARPFSTTTPHRIIRLKSLMKMRSLDAIICFRPENSFYLTGFNPTIYSNEIVSVLRRDRKEPILLVNTLCKEKAEATPGRHTVFSYGTSFDIRNSGETWQEALAEILGHGARNVGIEKEIMAAQRDELDSVFPEAKWSYVSDLIQACRNVKDPDEIANARAAAELCNASMAAIERSLLTDATERAAVQAGWNAGFSLWQEKYGDGNINGFGSREGGDFYGIKPRVHAGRRRFLPVDKPDGALIHDQAVSAHVWACYNGAHAELERTIFVGHVPKAQRLALARIQDIRGVVFSMIKPGVPLNALFEAAATRLSDLGYTLPGRIGHGIGLGAHEQLSIDANTETQLVEGMLLTIKPNVEVPEANVTTQHSDSIVVTATGYEFLAPYGTDPVRGI